MREAVLECRAEPITPKDAQTEQTGRKRGHQTREAKQVSAHDVSASDPPTTSPFPAYDFFLVDVFFPAGDFFPADDFLLVDDFRVAFLALSSSLDGQSKLGHNFQGPRAVVMTTSGAPHASHSSPVAVIAPTGGNG